MEQEFDMRALLLGLSGLLVASSGLALADTKLQTKPTPGASETTEERTLTSWP